MSENTGGQTESGRWVRQGGRIIVLPACGCASLSREMAWEGEVKPTRTPRRGRPAPTPTPTPRPGKGGATPACNQPVQTARSFKDYVALVRQAETALIGCGHRDAEQRLHVLTGIYYGTEWSRDYDVEKSPVRNLGFQTFVARRYGSGDDPRPCLRCGLFESLKRSGDAGGVDMGHVLIGMSARMRFLSRVPPMPGMGATGLELTTWVGDLGGAAARLALDRVKDPSAAASKYFRGKDYGATSNLEGDVAAYLVAAKSPTRVDAPAIPPGGLIADALESFFVKGTGRAARCRNFLAMLGGTVAGGRLANHAEVRDRMAGKLSTFGVSYLTNFQRQRGRDLSAVLSAQPLLKKAAEDVADLFIAKLLACRL
ncbi:MAG TPA: hypothetical protein VHG28_21905 [Longimicrobiaceae bacterium]|nr:hypothetical protein [Longimicrobiaceae bacterium]